MKPVILEPIRAFKLSYADWVEMRDADRIKELTEKYRCIGGADFTLDKGYMLLIPKEDL